MNQVNSSEPIDPAEVELEALIKLFFENESELGQFEKVEAAQVPDPSRTMLAHDHHMTLAVESHHGSYVDVEVLETTIADDHYSRKILLRRQSDRGVVQYGIVRLKLGLMSDQVRNEIESQATPLGRILINHDVLREVRLLNLFRIHCGTELAGSFGFEAGQECFGRTALIYCNGEPAIELLEIVC